MANRLERGLRRIDRWQQSRRVPGFVFGVIKKYGDDRGGSLAALITYYGFAALFPLLLLLTTSLGFALRGNPGFQKDVLNSALADFPVIGDQLRGSVHSLQGSALAVAIGCLGLLYGSLGIAQSLQFAMAQIWNVPGVRRPGYWPRLARSLLLILALGLGLLLSSAATAVLGAVSSGAVVFAFGLLASVCLNTVLYLACFSVLTPKDVHWRQMMPGCLIAGPVWTALQAFGGALVAHQLRHATQVYGLFGTVLGLLWWIYLGAQLSLYAAEVNVVRARRLWPRSILQPPLTPADRRVLDAIAEQNRRRPEQSVRSSFTDEEPGPDEGVGASSAAPGSSAGAASSAGAGSSAGAASPVGAGSSAGVASPVGAGSAGGGERLHERRSERDEAAGAVAEHGSSGEGARPAGRMRGFGGPQGG
ncbi:YihY/virulence factor BrkB family protein [Streptacidiphilus neutrinimicus]|uniref:YihY/virulence factor BrkB family protein n=1 Tax=Streptacidiphilus neutrinimicus TaxID=105420 RepID=UPI000694BF95|nr:YihY/virulence factor BrkB family protein [Streptacidiphilus neutrinimicus]